MCFHILFIYLFLWENYVKQNIHHSLVFYILIMCLKGSFKCSHECFYLFLLILFKIAFMTCTDFFF